MQFPNNVGPSGYGSPYDTPYGNADTPYMGGQPGWRSRRRVRRGCLGCLVPIVILVGIFALISFGWGLTITWGATVIKVGAQPTLIVESISNPNTEIHIHGGGNSGQIVIQPVRLLNLPFGPPESYQETSDHQTVIYDLSPNVSGTFDITVPTQTNLKIDANDAEILVDGITGQMHLETNSGLLIAKNSTILGPSLLRSNSGELQATQDHLSGSVALANNSASITFQGTLDPAGNYRFTADGGPISLTLPQNAALQINASTNAGSISSNIPGVHAQTSASGFTLQTSLGGAPRAQLILDNNSGNITLNEQGGQ